MRIDRTFLLLTSGLTWTLLGCAMPVDEKACATGKCDQAPLVSAQATEHGLFTCFAPELLDTQGRPGSCEPSGVILDGHDIVVVSDKEVPLKAPVFAMTYAADKLPTATPAYFESPILSGASKLEGITLTPDRTVLAVTAFDRPEALFNMLVTWPAGHPDQAAIVAATAGATSSLDLRAGIQAALASPKFPTGPAYFKLEGIAAVDDQMIFGVRQIGETKETAEFTFKMISTSYAIANGSVTLGDSFELVYEHDLATSAEVAGHQGVGLSDVGYDPASDRLWMTTSFEDSVQLEGLGGFLWTMPVDALRTHREPSLVRDAARAPLVFSHKPEGITVLDPTHLLVVYDDDRALGTGAEARTQNQAAYSVLEIAK